MALLEVKKYLHLENYKTVHFLEIILVAIFTLIY